METRTLILNVCSLNSKLNNAYVIRSELVCHIFYRFTSAYVNRIIKHP